VRADTAVPCLAEIAIHAKHLKPIGVSHFAKPTVQLTCCARFLAVFLPHVSIVVDVIQRQKLQFGFSATGAFVTTIPHECFVLGLLSTPLRIRSKQFSPFWIMLALLGASRLGCCILSCSRFLVIGPIPGFLSERFARLAFMPPITFSSLRDIELGYGFGFVASLTGSFSFLVGIALSRSFFLIHDYILM